MSYPFLQRRFSATASSAGLRLYSRLQWRRLERFEREEELAWLQ